MDSEGIFEKLTTYKNGANPVPVTSLESKAALDFFLGHDQYCTTELPEYFDFSGVIEYTKASVGDKSHSNCYCYANQ